MLLLIGFQIVTFQFLRFRVLYNVQNTILLDTEV